jgi:tRNA1Val (adenine37-N6)-methyltransferase
VAEHDAVNASFTALVPSPFTDDALFGGRVALRQPAKGEGYRANVDALLLAAFARSERVSKLAYDLGAGSGAVGLALLALAATERVVLVEADGAASEAARANLETNGWADRGEVLACDVGDAARLPPAGADLVVCNPPYVAPGKGRAPKRPGTARARSGELVPFTRAARRVLGRRARACFVYPARELGALWSALLDAGLVPKRLRAVHADANARARIVLVEACPGKPGGLSIEPPFVEREGGRYTAEMALLLDGALTTSRRAGGRERSRRPRAR